MTISERLELAHDNLVHELVGTDEKLEKALINGQVFRSALNAAELISLGAQLAPLDLVKGIRERSLTRTAQAGAILVFTPVNVIGYPLLTTVRALGNKVTNSEMF